MLVRWGTLFERAIRGGALPTLRLPGAAECPAALHAAARYALRGDQVGPRRATGPDLVGLLGGGFAFGVVTRAVFSVHPAPETEILWTLRAPQLAPLLRFAAEEARSGVPPRRLLAIRDQAPEVPQKEQGWLLHLSWHEDHGHARSLGDRAS